jgi:ribosomal protein S18 acetylase RimI-like enzyme
VENIELRLTELGCPKINLQVRESNIDTITFYQSLGHKNDNVISLGKRLLNDN